jgi:hypothetical protein
VMILTTCVNFGGKIDYIRFSLYFRAMIGACCSVVPMADIIDLVKRVACIIIVQFPRIRKTMSVKARDSLP